MSEKRSTVIEALRQGARGSGSEYVTVRREDLLLALGAEETVPPARKSTPEPGPRTTDKS